jgi:thiamine-phosphate pyrophosphorylase
VRGAPAAVPRLLVLTDRGQAAAVGRSVPATVADALDGGPFDVVVREKDLPRQQRAALVGQLLELLAPVGGRVLVASDAALAHRLGAHGVHLAAGDPWPDVAFAVVGRSCHDAGEVGRAVARADYVTVSPVFATASKPGYGPALGLDGLERAVADAPPVALALGGVDAARVAGCLVAGAAGVAVMGAVMGSADPAAAVASLRQALDADADAAGPADGPTLARPA